MQTTITPGSGAKDLVAGTYTTIFTAPTTCISAVVNARVTSHDLTKSIKIRAAIVPAGFVDGTTAPAGDKWLQPLDIIIGPTGIVQGVIEDTGIVLNPGESIIAYTDLGFATARVHGFIRNVDTTAGTGTGTGTGTGGATVASVTAAQTAADTANAGVAALQTSVAAASAAAQAAQTTANSATTAVAGVTSTANNALAVANAAAKATNWVVKTTAYTAAANDGIFANTTGAAFVVLLPLAPLNGDEVSFADPLGTWGTNNLTINGNSHSVIQAGKTDLICDVANANFNLTFDSTTTTWRKTA